MSPATNRTPAEWGRVAVSLPGWQWLPRMQSVALWGDPGETWLDYWTVRADSRDFMAIGPCCAGHPDDNRERWPDPNDPATAGCLLALLGHNVDTCSCGDGVDVTLVDRDASGHGPNLGTACIAAAEALGRWPGGGQ